MLWEVAVNQALKSPSVWCEFWKLMIRKDAKSLLIIFAILLKQG